MSKEKEDKYEYSTMKFDSNKPSDICAVVGCPNPTFLDIKLKKGKYGLCRNHWNELAESDTEWSSEK